MEQQKQQPLPIHLYLLALLAIVALFALPFLLNPDAQFGGADNAGRDLIAQQDPNYTPWYSSWWQPPPETESMLFALQAAIGAIIIGYFIGYERGKAAGAAN
ncbi:energy-coupling factor ABC transporter substrate-binding protein [Candidatus Micrarchaeota archaeon]|nr:energy-coupling factor ABC transporter substrate-binding protein [Candidatus Micrarchaeota archaeon]